MSRIATDLRLSEPDIRLMSKLSLAEKISLAAATVIAALNLLGWLAPALRGVFRGGWRPMSAEAAVAVLLSAASLYLTRPRFVDRKPALAMVLAAVMTAGSAMVFIGHLLYATSFLSITAGWLGGHSMTPHAAATFALGGLAILLIRARGGPAGLAADCVTFCLGFLVLSLASGHVIGVLPFFGPTATFRTAAQTMVCMVLLTLVVVIRRAEYGVFSILLGRGIGSKVARVLAPLLIVLPYVREGLRAHLVGLGRIPSHYTTSFLATGAMTLSMALLMYLAWRLNALEEEIQGLSLRDPLTGLHNLRGFRLLSEQALMLAHRSGQPFSVLYIDVDNLKQINDALGHQTGSEFLSATAEILRENFRETDVLGRIGGDEFAVAGQFNRTAIAEAARRLCQEAALRIVSGTAVPLSLSVGSVTSSGHKRELLADLLAKADEEMYREKRKRKEAAKKRAEQGLEEAALRIKAARLHELEPS